jgi:hypothetical protein
VVVGQRSSDWPGRDAIMALAFAMRKEFRDLAFGSI